MTRVYALERRIVISMCIGLAVLMVTMSATAKAGSRISSGATSEADVEAIAAGEEGEDHWMLGAGVGWVPEFQGADDYKWQPLPLIDVQYGRFFVKLGDGIGINFFSVPAFTIGGSLKWMPGYDAGDVPKGIKATDDAVGARLFVTSRFLGFATKISVTRAVTESERGLLVNAGLAYPVSVTERLVIRPRLGVTWADQKYMNSYFGIDASEAAASGWKYYRPASGFKDVSFNVAIRYRITGHVAVFGSLGVTRLVGEAADSPLIEQQTQASVLVGLTYNF